MPTFPLVHECLRLLFDLTVRRKSARGLRLFAEAQEPTVELEGVGNLHAEVDGAVGLVFEVS
jgi:hypothetical protein